MNIGKVIYDILSNDPGVSGVVGNKIYPMRVPQGIASPSITYTIIYNTPSDTKQGPSELDVTRFQINCFDPQYSVVDNLSALVREALDRVSGTIQAVVVDKIIYENEVDLFDEDSQEHYRATDYRIRIKR